MDNDTQADAVRSGRDRRSAAGLVTTNLVAAGAVTLGLLAGCSDDADEGAASTPTAAVSVPGAHEGPAQPGPAQADPSSTAGAQPGTTAAAASGPGTPTTAPASTAAPVTVGPGPADAATANAAVVVRDDGAVALLDPSSGRIGQVLAPPGTAHAAPGSAFVSRSTDGGQLVVQGGNDICVDGSVLRVPAGGGGPERLATGSTPAVSPDGTQLAYSASDPGSASCAALLVVRDLTSGAERRWPLASAVEGDAILSLSWAPDGQALAVEYGYEATGKVTIHRLDQQGPVGGPGAGPTGPAGGDAIWSSPSYSAASGRVVVVEHAFEGDDPEPRAPRALAFEPATGRTQPLPVELPPAVEAIDLDRSGDRILYTVVDERGRGTLWRTDSSGAGGRAGDRLTDGVSAVDW